MGLMRTAAYLLLAAIVALSGCQTLFAAGPAAATPAAEPPR